jgi:hypothetical protein
VYAPEFVDVHGNGLVMYCLGSKTVSFGAARNTVACDFLKAAGMRVLSLHLSDTFTEQ